MGPVLEQSPEVLQVPVYRLQGEQKMLLILAILSHR